ncbi:hypothetical protein D6D23_08267 [Aureobasidium pullulans]|nr:hypothetical protein D6D23_08267 [Aureobasidium pullulans]
MSPKTFDNSMSEQQFEDIIAIFRKSLDVSETLTQEERHKVSFRLPPAEEDAIVQAKTRYPSRASLVQGCLERGALDLTDDEIDIIIRGVASGPASVGDSLLSFLKQQSPEVKELADKVYESNEFTDPGELKAILQCYKEQGYRREQKRTTRQLHRYRLVERRYLELLQDSIQRGKPSHEDALKRRALEQIMRETKGQVDFPQAPTNDSISWKIQDFAIKAQRKPYLDIGIWGFVILRLDYRDDTLWESYKSRVETCTQKVLTANDVPENVCRMLRFTYLEDESALSGEVDQTKLVKYWRDNRWNENVHIHMNHDFFLSADWKAMDNENTTDPPMYLHDAYIEEIPTDLSSFPGYIPMTALHFCSKGIAGINDDRQYVRSIWDILH